MENDLKDLLSDSILEDNDPNASGRKKDHIELALKSQIQRELIDDRFYYEPLLSAHPQANSWPKFSFLNKPFNYPIWVSSMTGGTEWASVINKNLARACGEFGFGMGLGSCRSLLSDDTYFSDFDVRKVMGNEVPLYANLGIAQIEQLIDEEKVVLAVEMVKKLRADGLIIHVNPLQEWLQPEGDRFKKPPLETIQRFIDQTSIKIIVKEVGQGMGYESLKALLQLPLEAVDFAANGGTNFAKLELLRSSEQKQTIYSELANVGHSALDMVNITNQLKEELGDKICCKQIIISGGVRSFLDGYYLINKLNFPAVYGQAAGFLKYACGSYELLQNHVKTQIKGLELANAFLKVRD